MSFEEKLAAYGRKLDEKKAKLDAAISARKQERKETREEIEADIAKLEAQIDKQYDTLGAQIEKQYDTLDAQIEKQYDTLDAQIEKQYDTMDAQIERQFDTMEDRAEKLDAQIEKQFDTLDAQAQKQIDDLNAAVDLAEEKAEQDIAKVKAAFTLDKSTAEAIANEPTKFDDIQKGTEEQIARAKGDIAAAEEDIRLTREERARKRDALQLRVQMKVNNAKEQVAERKEARDKAAQEAWILDLLDYADNCYGMAYAWALEAEYTLMEAAYELDYYNERFGKEE